MAGPIVLPSGASVAAGIVLPLYRRELGPQVGDFQVATLTGESSHGEARTHAVSELFIDTELERGAWNGLHLYIADGDHAGHQARILSSGYHGSGGVVEISRPVPSRLAAGTTVEISGPLPCNQYLTRPGLNQIVNWALRRSDIEYRQVLTGDGTRSLSLLDYEQFIDQDDRADVVYDGWGLSSGDPLEARLFGSHVETSGASRTLVTDVAYLSSDTVELRVIRAGHTLIKTNGAWGTSTVGLVSDDQAAAVPIPWVVAIGAYKALGVAMRLVRNDRTIDRGERQDRLNDLANDRAEWGAAAAKIILEDFPKRTAPEPRLPVVVRRSGRSWS